MKTLFKIIYDICGYHWKMCIPDKTLIMSTTGKQKKKKKMEGEEDEEDKQKNCASVEHWLEWLYIN